MTIGSTDLSLNGYRLGSQSDEAGIKAGKVEQADDSQSLPVGRTHSASKRLCFVHK